MGPGCVPGTGPGAEAWTRAALPASACDGSRLPGLCHDSHCAAVAGVFLLPPEWVVLGLAAHHTVSSVLCNKDNLKKKNPNLRFSPGASLQTPCCGLSWACVGGLAPAPAPRPSHLERELSLEGALGSPL